MIPEEGTYGYILSLQNQVMGPRAENARLRRALDLSGIPAQAALDDKAPPLKTTVAGAREIMGVVNG